MSFETIGEVRRGYVLTPEEKAAQKLTALFAGAQVHFEYGYPDDPEAAVVHKEFCQQLGIDPEVEHLLDTYATTPIRHSYPNDKAVTRQIIPVSDFGNAAFISYLAEEPKKLL